MIPVAESLAKTVLGTGEPLVVTDLASEQGTTQSMRTAMAHIGHAVMFPVGPPANVRGVLEVIRLDNHLTQA